MVELAVILRWLNIVETLGGIIERCVAKLDEVRQPGFDPNSIDLAAMKAELVGLPDLPEKP